MLLVKLATLVFYELLLTTDSYANNSNLVKDLLKKDKRYATSYPSPPPPTPADRYTQVMSYAMQSPLVVPCPRSRQRRVSLSNAQLMNMLHSQGGLFHPTLMAVDEDQAMSNFPNNLPSGRSEDIYLEKPNGTVTKEKLIDDLTKWEEFINSPRISPKRNRNENVRKNSAMQRLASELGNYIMNSRIKPEDIISFIEEHNIIHHPKILHLIKKPRNDRIKRDNGVTASTNFCQRRGNKTDNGFLYFCSQCSVTTDLGQYIFPRYINEVECGKDRVCLTYKGQPHGACQQNLLHLNFLRRKPGGCKYMIDDHHSEFVEAWETYTQEIRVSCSCRMDKRSRLARVFFGK